MESRSFLEALHVISSETVCVSVCVFVREGASVYVCSAHMCGPARVSACLCSGCVCVCGWKSAYVCLCVGVYACACMHTCVCLCVITCACERDARKLNLT